MILNALRSIVDLLKIKQEAKKTGLEIQKLSREEKDAGSLLRIASLDEIKKFDPRVKELEERFGSRLQRELNDFGSLYRRSRFWLWIMVLLLLAIMYFS
jgi:hypothetical protein